MSDGTHRRNAIEDILGVAVKRGDDVISPCNIPMNPKSFAIEDDTGLVEDDIQKGARRGRKSHEGLSQCY